MADLNKSVIGAYGENVKTIKTNEEIISGIYPVPLPVIHLDIVDLE